MIMISEFKDDNILSIIASPPYGPPLIHTLIIILSFITFFYFFASVGMLVVQNLLG